MWFIELCFFKISVRFFFLVSLLLYWISQSCPELLSLFQSAVPWADFKSLFWFIYQHFIYFDILVYVIRVINFKKHITFFIFLKFLYWELHIYWDRHLLHFYVKAFLLTSFLLMLCFAILVHFVMFSFFTAGNHSVISL